jgi:formiminotetrahydrofolate cyclodeaminase
MREIERFVASVAAAEPLPGGGSSAALAGALAAALGEMMAGLTEGKASPAPLQRHVKEIHIKLSGLRTVLQNLIEEDVTAYQSLLNALRLPRETGQQRALRAAAIEEHARSATETPLQTARAAFSVMECLKTLIEIGNPHAKCDAAVGTQLAYAAVKGSQYNVLSNIGMLKDSVLAGSCRAEISDLVSRGGEILRSIDRQMTADRET